MQVFVQFGECAFRIGQRHASKGANLIPFSNSIYRCRRHLDVAQVASQESRRGMRRALQLIAGYLVLSTTPDYHDPGSPLPMSRDESPLPEPKSNSRLSCPACNAIVLPLPGHSAVQALEGHMERDHWYPRQVAHVAATEALEQAHAVIWWPYKKPRFTA